MDRLGVFAKYWAPGKVKTRLAADVGDEVASEIYRHCVEAILARLHGESRQCLLCFSPSDQREAFRSFEPRWSLQSQGEGDLGQRMRRYFDRAFDAGCQRVVLLGSDSPNVPVEYVQAAFEMLSTHDIVLGPTPDGGYYLVGASGQTPDVFAGIAWSTPDVWQQTMDNVQNAELRCGALPPWYDVDDLEDLHRLRVDLNGTAETSLVLLRDMIDRQLPTAL